MAEKLVHSPINPAHRVETFEGGFAGKDMVSIEQFTHPDQVHALFGIAQAMEDIVESHRKSDLLEDKGVVLAFYQPSTRTYFSFKSAAEWLGSRSVDAEQNMNFTSVYKGESLADTVQAIEQTTATDLIVLRHPENNSAFEAAEAASVPVVNGGSGTLEHPTQALLDLYTIKHRLGRTTGLKVGMVGDLVNGRTVKSLGKLLTLVDPQAQLYLISPQVLEMPRREVLELQARGATVTETPDLMSVLPELDVLYATRIQKEWFVTPEQHQLYNSLKGQYDITNKTMQQAKKEMILMHPLPRLEEIATEVDSDPRAVYMEQMRMGLYVRMALLSLLTGKIK